jgi:hypothetical protein
LAAEDLMGDLALQHRAAPPPSGPVALAVPGVAGPFHARLARTVAVLNAAPVVQRMVVLVSHLRAPARIGPAHAGPVPAGPVPANLGPIGVVQRAIDNAGLARVQAFKATPGATVIVRNGAGTAFQVTGFAAGTVTLHDPEAVTTANVTLAAFQANYSIVSFAHGGMAIPEADYTDQSAHTQARNGSQVIDVSGHPIGFAHYSYDLLRPAGGGANQRDNDHLTIENALGLFLQKLRKKEGADDIAYFLEHKPQQTKADINQELRLNHKLAELDNFNFRPLVQGPRAVTAALDPAGTLRADHASAKPAAAASGPVAVDAQLSLAHFMAYTRTALQRMQVPGLVIAQLEQSVADEATTRMGFPLANLFLNSGQIKDVVRFALVFRNVVDLNWMERPVPSPLAGFTSDPPYVDITHEDFEQLRVGLQAGVNAGAFEAIRLAIEADDYWRADSGSPNYAAVSHFLANHYWPVIRDWIVHP